MGLSHVFTRRPHSLSFASSCALPRVVPDKMYLTAAASPAKPFLAMLNSRDASRTPAWVC